MTNPEIVEAWRSEFEAKFSPMFSMHRKASTTSMVSFGFIPSIPNGYESVHTDCAWQGFLVARSTVEIEIPEKIKRIDAQYHDIVYVEHLVISVQSQGYRVKGE